MKKLGMQTKDRDVDGIESRNMKFDIIKGHLCVKCNTAVAAAGLAGFVGRRNHTEKSTAHLNVIEIEAHLTSNAGATQPAPPPLHSNIRMHVQPPWQGG